MNEIQFKSRVMPLHKTLYAYAFAILRDENDAADCLQESFTRLWENRSRLATIENVEAYATVTVRNIALTMAKRHNSRISPFGDDPPDMPDPDPDPGLAAEETDDLRTVRKLLDLLPENQRRVVMLSSVAGLSNSEITRATGITHDNVRVLLSRGRKRLRQLFSLRTGQELHQIIEK